MVPNKVAESETSLSEHSLEARHVNLTRAAYHVCYARNRARRERERETGERNGIEEK